MRPPGTPGAPPVPGWYPDPSGSGSYRWWDGGRWTDALSSAIPPAGPHLERDDARNWALAAHLSPIVSLFVGLPPIGPLIVYLAKKDDPYVRRHAAEALNFNISFLIYAIVLGAAMFVLLFVVIGLALIPLLFALFVAWIVLIALAANKAGQGEEYRYPLTIRFLR